MGLDGDVLVDRRRLKRRLTFWRVVALVALIIAVIVGVGRFDRIVQRSSVARLDVEGIIIDDQERNEALAKLAQNDAVKALIVRIDSPGGTVVGGESLYNHLRMVAELKPVVAVMGEVATSAAYMTALGSDHIIAREGTITGSIGVILQAADLTGLLEKLGVKPEVIKSGPLKAQPNPLEPLTKEGRVVAQQVIDDLYRMFVDLVEKERGLEREQALLVADGRIFTGRQALEEGLVDAIGGEAEARTWLDETHGIDLTLPIRDIELDGPEETVRDLIGRALGKVLFSERLKLDGLVSVWHPDL